MATTAKTHPWTQFGTSDGIRGRAKTQNQINIYLKRSLAEQTAFLPDVLQNEETLPGTDRNIVDRDGAELLPSLATDLGHGAVFVAVHLPAVSKLHGRPTREKLSRCTVVFAVPVHVTAEAAKCPREGFRCGHFYVILFRPADDDATVGGNGDAVLI